MSQPCEINFLQDFSRCFFFLHSYPKFVWNILLLCIKINLKRLIRRFFLLDFLFFMFLINFVTHHSIYSKNINIWNIFWAQTLSTPSRSTISLYVYHINVHNTVQYCISRFFPIIFSFPQLLFPYCKKKNKKKKANKI